MNYFIERFADAYREEMAAFVEMVETGTEPLAGISDGLEAQRIAEAAIVSMQTGQPVNLARLAASVTKREDKMTREALAALPEGVRLGVSPFSWANDVLEDLGADISLDTCLSDAADVGYEGIELGRKFPRDAAVLGPLLKEHGLALASGWHSGELAERSVNAEMAAVADHATPPARRSAAR